MTYGATRQDGFIEGYSSTSSTSTTTTAPPSYSFEYGATRRATLPAHSEDRVAVYLPTATATDGKSFSLKCYVYFDGKMGIFDGDGVNRIDDGAGNLIDFSVIAPQYRPSYSTTTSTTSTSTSTSTTTSTTTTTVTTVSTSTTSAPWYFAASLITVAGGVDSGTMDSMKIDDGARYVLTEVAGTPGFDYQFEFDGVPTGWLKISINGYYDGNPAHEVWIYAYNHNTSAWDRLTADATDLPDAAADADYAFYIPYPGSNYVSLGNVHVRIYHPDPGNTSHRLYLDLLRIDEASSSTTTT